MRVKAMKCGRTENGVVYPYGVVSNAAHEFMKKPYRPVFIEGTNVTCNDLGQLAGVVNSMEIDDNVLYADITFLDTPNGRIANTLVKDIPECIGFSVKGSVEESRSEDFTLINKLDIFAIEIYPKRRADE